MTGDFMKDEGRAAFAAGPAPEGRKWDPVELRNVLEFIMTLVWVEIALSDKITKSDVHEHPL